MRSRPAQRASAALLAGACLATSCAHAPERGARREDAPRTERVLVTGSRMPRPVSRTGLPVADFSVKIYPWRPADAGR